MYLPIKSQPSCARAWLEAASQVRDAGGEAHNVIIDIDNPITEDPLDAAINQEVDRFLRSHNSYPLASVVNTIFPQGLLQQHGPEKLYDSYRRVFPKMKQVTHDWGRYFDRLVRWKKFDKGQIEIINPLDDLVSFMKRQIEGGTPYRNVYELTTYDPTLDAGKVSNRQCLSFLSFKLTKDGRLLLTAVYRNHAYIARGLGNFIGLGRLQAFVASEVGLALGSLTCVSTHAEIDAGTRQKDGKKVGWTRSQAESLLDACAALNKQSYSQLAS